MTFYIYIVFAFKYYLCRVLMSKVARSSAKLIKERRLGHYDNASNSGYFYQATKIYQTFLVKAHA